MKGKWIYKASQALTAASFLVLMTCSHRSDARQGGDFGVIRDTEPYSVRMMLSEMARNPQATWLDGRQGQLKWNYTTGLELLSFMDVAERYDLDYATEYVRQWADTMATEDGDVYRYRKEAYNVDHICPARIYFRLYEDSGDKKYRRVLRKIRAQIDTQPRTEDGIFWHKQIYPHQVWLDGLYMAQPFYAEYTKRFSPKAERDSFAVEIYLPEGRTLDETAEVAADFEAYLKKDGRVKSVTAFIGSGSPRFMAAYSPNLPASNYAQFIVNTASNNDAKALIAKFKDSSFDIYPEASVRVKQLDYQASACPIEIRLSGDDVPELRRYADTLVRFMHTLDDELVWIHKDYDAYRYSVRLDMKPDEAA